MRWSQVRVGRRVGGDVRHPNLLFVNEAARSHFDVVPLRVIDISECRWIKEVVR